MVLNIVPSSLTPRKEPENLLELVTTLRRLSKHSVIDIGTELLWRAFRDEETREISLSESRIIEAYGARIVFLAFATANDHRNTHAVANTFTELCRDYLGIGDTISSQDFLDQEAKSIIEACRRTDNGRIDDRYLTYEHVRSSTRELFMARLLRSQHHNHHAKFEELTRGYQVFTLLDSMTRTTATQICRATFNIDPVHFFRSGFMLFAHARDSNGKIDFRHLRAEVRVREELGIDEETCRLVASHLSYRESQLRTWYTTKILSEAPLYQKYCPDPFYQYPLVHRDLKAENLDFLIPSPGTFMRGFTEAFFARILEQDANAGSRLGAAIETHIEEALRSIFGNARVERISGGGEHADFYLELDQFRLIIETKTSLRGYHAQCTMKPDQIADIWAVLHKATKQCAASIHTYRERSNLPILALVIVADNVTGEAMPFQTFCERSGLYRDLGIEGVEFLAWNSLEYVLSKTSIANLSEAFVKKWVRNERQSVGDLLSFQVSRGEPAHSYQYLQTTEDYLWPF